jgi:uncharacterized YigZ family protein
MSDTYLTIAETGRSLFKEKGSKFIGIACHVNDENSFREELESIRKEFHDARHVCHGFSHGLDTAIEGRSDDGEPAHSAGDPILGQIHAFALKNAAVFVVRYFGGTKLGVGGLKQAYKQAAMQAIENAVLVEKMITDRISISFAYEQSPEIMRLIPEFEGRIAAQEYSGSCLLEVEVGKSRTLHFCDRLEELDYLGVKYKNLTRAKS